MIDRVLAGFLRVQRDEGLALAAASDILELLPLGGDTPQHYLACFNCRGLVRAANGDIAVADSFKLSVWFHDEYLHAADPLRVLSWLEPANAFQPSIRAPFICVGPIAAGTTLTDLLYRCFEVITWSRVTTHEPNTLNPDAAKWARANRDRWPVDPRPLKRRTSVAGTAVLASLASELLVEPITVRR